MEDFKISLFESRYNQSFPKYRELSKPECQKFVSAIASRYDINLANFAIDLNSKQSVFDVNSSEGFKLINNLSLMKIEPLRTVFVNWYKFERIDALNIDDIDKYFYDLWFPVAEDIDLFDESLNWIVSIRHDGCVSFIKDA